MSLTLIDNTLRSYFRKKYFRTLEQTAAKRKNIQRKAEKLLRYNLTHFLLFQTLEIIQSFQKLKIYEAKKNKYILIF